MGSNQNPIVQAEHHIITLSYCSKTIHNIQWINTIIASLLCIYKIFGLLILLWNVLYTDLFHGNFFGQLLPILDLVQWQQIDYSQRNTAGSFQNGQYIIEWSGCGMQVYSTSNLPQLRLYNTHKHPPSLPIIIVVVVYSYVPNPASPMLGIAGYWTKLTTATYLIPSTDHTQK